jgi:MFS family permease
MTWGTLLLSGGFFALSVTRSLWQFYVVLAVLVASGAAMVGGVAASSLVAQWFVVRRGMALGVATMGISLSGVVMAPVATVLIARIGWRASFVVYGVLTLLVVLPAVRHFVVDRPEDLGLVPDGQIIPRAPLRPLADPSKFSRPTTDVAKLATSPSFWLIAGTISLNMSANGAVLTHIIPHATDLGIPPRQAAWILSLIAGFGVLGKVVFGWTSDRFDKRIALWIISGLQATAVALLLVVEQPMGLFAVGALFGLGMGGLVPLWGAMIGSFFGRRAFGRVMGLMSPVMLPIQASGTPLAGFLFDQRGSYHAAFALFVVLYLTSMLLGAYLVAPLEEPGFD